MEGMEGDHNVPMAVAAQGMCMCLNRKLYGKQKATASQSFRFRYRLTE